MSVPALEITLIADGTLYYNHYRRYLGFIKISEKKGIYSSVAEMKKSISDLFNEKRINEYTFYDYRNITVTCDYNDVGLLQYLD